MNNFVRRGIFFIVVLILSMFAVFIITSGDAGEPSYKISDPVTLSEQNINMELTPDGMLTADENLTAEFPTSPPRRGIFRFFNTSTRANENIRLKVRDIKTTLDGGNVPVSFSTERSAGEEFYVAKLGSEDVIVPPGTHVYNIAYTVKGATFQPNTGEGNFVTTEGVKPDSAKSVFYWNVIAPGWAMFTQSATASVKFPEPVKYVECSAGTEDTSLGGCEVSGLGTDTLTISADNIPPYSGVTVRVPLTTVEPSAKTLPWPAKYDTILGKNIITPIFFLLLSIFTTVISWRWANDASETPPGEPLTYQPPNNLPPPHVEYLTSSPP